MREIKDFDTEKKIYIGKVLNHIAYQKLHPRIYEDISTHMDDMYEDFSSKYKDEAEITKKVIDGMGDPNELGKELQKIHKPVILRARIIKSIIQLIIFLLIPIVVPYVCDEVYDYINSYSVEKAEQWLVENKEEADTIKLLTEIEHDGIVHRIYAPENQDENFNIYHMHSIKCFGINTKSRFDPTDHLFISHDTYVVVDLNPQNSKFEDSLFIFFSNPEEEYLKIKYTPTEEGLEEYWSDFIKVPQDGTIEKPQYILFDCPDGYRWNFYGRFDKNKNSIDNYDFIGPEPR